VLSLYVRREVRSVSEVDAALLAGELRVALGALIRRLRAQRGFSLSQAAVLGRLDREGPCSIGELAVAERVRPQSMAQTVGGLQASGLLTRDTDPSDARRALLALTAEGRATLAADRRQREGWLAEAIARELSPEEQALLADTVRIIKRLADC
jgi:DNA-binding MarR family transcriptional regulator